MRTQKKSASTAMEKYVLSHAERKLQLKLRKREKLIVLSEKGLKNGRDGFDAIHFKGIGGQARMSVTVPVRPETIKEVREKMLKLVDELAFNDVTARRYDKIRQEVSKFADDLFYDDIHNTSVASEAKQ